jgi:hypothetical protein
MKNTIRGAVKPLLLSVCVFTAAGLFGQTAVVRDLTGTVEIKAPGRAEWTPVRRGQELSGNTLISTGFKSSALIELGNSTLTVHPLTRLSITELFREGSSERVSLNLRAGRVRADVKPPAGGSLDFSVRSPVATASVRGTVFEQDTQNLYVSEGTVEFMGTGTGTAVLVDGGGATFVDGTTGRPVSPAETAALELRPEPPPGTEAAIPANGAAADQNIGSELGVGVTF